MEPTWKKQNNTEGSCHEIQDLQRKYIITDGKLCIFEKMKIILIVNNRTIVVINIFIWQQTTRWFRN